MRFRLLDVPHLKAKARRSDMADKVVYLFIGMVCQSARCAIYLMTFMIVQYAVEKIVTVRLLTWSHFLIERNKVLIFF